MPTQSNARATPSWATAQKVGAPDHEPSVYQARTSTRIVLNFNEAVIRLGILATPLASAFPHRVAPLASGVETFVINLATGIDTGTTPFPVPVGNTFSILSYWWAFDQPILGRMYIDGQLMSNLHENAYFSHYEHDILEDFYAIDPLGALPHTLGYSAENDGTADMVGYYMFVGKLIETGTPPFPELKEVKCTFCGHLYDIDRKLGPSKCPKCRQISTYFPILFGSEYKDLPTHITIKEEI